MAPEQAPRKGPTILPPHPTTLDHFRESLAFPLDDFQLRACEAVQEGNGVLVAAPTGAGKTIVGEFAVYAALERGTRCFYTTPIKALSNQKFNDFVATYGEDAVGLLTGDVSIRRDAPIVVMTTEVLRNMIYQDVRLDDVDFVVMDEVHYLADAERGPTWEEVILNLDERIRIIALSATVSNVDEFGAWLEAVHGATTVVTATHRPIPLTQYALVADEILPLVAGNGGVHGDAGSSVATPKPSPELTRRLALARHQQQADYRSRKVTRYRGNRGGGPQKKRPGQVGGSSQRRQGEQRMGFDAPTTVRALRAANMVPAIMFIFSRAGCDKALYACAGARLRLTSEEEQRQILDYVDAAVKDIPEESLQLMDFRRWRLSLANGFAQHHAGMLPVFRHIVEHLFTEGLLKVIFATTTLALGINMPARTVVISELRRFDGVGRVELTPAEYTQLIGRAGRRGIDTHGNAVIAWDNRYEPEGVVRLATTADYPLNSTFRPGYNMTVNVLNRYGVDGAHRMMERSFAQFQAGDRVVRDAAQTRRLEQKLDAINRELTTLLADEQLADILGTEMSEAEAVAAVQTYATARDTLEAAKKEHEQQAQRELEANVRAILRGLRRGDVIALPEGKDPTHAVVVREDHNRANPRPTIITERGEVRRLAAPEMGNPPVVTDTLGLPRDAGQRPERAVELVVSAFRHSPISRLSRLSPTVRRRRSKRIGQLIAELKALGVHAWRYRETAITLLRERDKLTASLSGETKVDDNSLVAVFDRMAGLLAERGYVEQSDDADEGAETTYRVTEDGNGLASIHHSSDLLVAECLRRRIWTGLDPAELAGVVSTIAAEVRPVGQPRVVYPSDEALTAMSNTLRLWEEIADDEARWRLPETPMPEERTLLAVHQWTAGAPLDHVLRAASFAGVKLTPGDFVRLCQRVMDLLRQIAFSSELGSDLAAAARQALDAMDRDVVALT